MIVYLTRETVSAGDDCDAPHAHRFAMSDEWTWEELVELARVEARLPFIQGGLATWGLSSNFPLAVVAQQWTQAKLLFLTRADRGRLDWHDGELWLHWSYFQQLNPNLVHQVLRDLKLRAAATS